MTQENATCKVTKIQY